eukprot:NODE_316_length_11188_cov_0.303905.p7 type:complete len:130 gc:universal NODE_316_length_11188_cov_0.303905:10552-10941(+)
MRPDSISKTNLNNIFALSKQTLRTGIVTAFEKNCDAFGMLCNVGGQSGHTATKINHRIIPHIQWEVLAAWSKSSNVFSNAVSINHQLNTPTKIPIQIKVNFAGNCDRQFLVCSPQETTSIALGRLNSWA